MVIPEELETRHPPRVTWRHPQQGKRYSATTLSLPIHAHGILGAAGGAGQKFLYYWYWSWYWHWHWFAGANLRFSPLCSPSRSLAVKCRLTRRRRRRWLWARASGSAARGDAGGLPLEAVEALEAAACVAHDDGGGDVLGLVGHPLGGAAVLICGAVAAVARVLHVQCTCIQKAERPVLIGIVKGGVDGRLGRRSSWPVAELTRRTAVR